MKATAFPRAALRPRLPSDTPLLAAILEDSVAVLAEDDYDEGQRRAWVSAADGPDFLERLTAALTLVATVAGSPVGFITMDARGHIASLYVHSAVARHGVGSLLYDAIEKLATGRGIKQLTADVSDNAKPFFDAKGFEARHRQTVEIGGHWLGNTRMEKGLG